MKIHMLSIGKGMPPWVKQGFEEYQKRMPREFEVVLHEINAIQRGNNANLAKIRQEESERILEKIPIDCYCIALDPKGKSISNEALAQALDQYYQNHQDIALIIGGPEGLSEALLAKMSQHWSLSALTFPHMLVRIMLAEQLYRAVTIIRNMPYHR